MPPRRERFRARRWVFLAAAMAAGQAKAGAVTEHLRPWPKGELPYRFTTDLLKAAGAKGQEKPLLTTPLLTT